MSAITKHVAGGRSAVSVAHADPSAETPLCLTTLGGEIELTSARGVRRAKPEDFFVGALMTEREGDEMVSALILPVSAPVTGIGFEEINERHGDFAIVAAAAWPPAMERFPLWLGLGGAEDRPFAVQGNTSNDTSAIHEAVAEIVRDIEPLDDQKELPPRIAATRHPISADASFNKPSRRRRDPVAGPTHACDMYRQRRR